MVEVTCPYCEAEFEDEIEDYSESTVHEVECPECEKVFGYNVCISIDTDSFEMPCGGQQGDGPHDYERYVFGIPDEECKKMVRCRYCGLEKVLKSEDSCNH